MSARTASIRIELQLLLGIVVLHSAIADAFAEDIVLRLKPSLGPTSTASAMSFDTLQAAVDKATSPELNKYDGVRIEVSPGRYERQIATTHGRPEGKKLVVIAETPSQRPVFDGNGRGGTFFKLENASGHATNVIIAGLEITNYASAISFNGDRGSKSTGNSENIIRNNVFRNIGNMTNPKSEPSTAAVRLVNSDHNEIGMNQFINIRNSTRCDLLHSIYMAHMSSYNRIEDNSFEGGCGVTIKVRDSSNNNTIKNNRFSDQETITTFGDAFCDDRKRECSKDEAECPSWGNIYADNNIVPAAGAPQILPVKVYVDTGPKTCGSPKGEKRILESRTTIQKR